MWLLISSSPCLIQESVTELHHRSHRTGPLIQKTGCTGLIKTMEMQLTHLQVLDTTLHRTQHPTPLEIEKKAHDFCFQLRLDPQRLNTNQFLTELEDIVTLATAALALHPNRGEMACPLNKHGPAGGIGWQ